MSMFKSILSKLGLGGEETATEAQKPVPAPEAEANATLEPPAEFSPRPEPSSMNDIDVVTKLETLASANPQKLNWKTSIVDLLKLLGLDSSYDARKELATELGCPAEKMGDSALMNMWLHKEVMKRLAENGGNIPAELLD